jgi:hypothetical protein
MAEKPRSRRNPLVIGLIVLVAISLVFAAAQLLSLSGSFGAGVIAPPLDLTPEPGEDNPDPQQPDGEVISSDDLRELSLALAAVITALTGLLGLVATQIWRTREEGRLDQRHSLALERERLELERERLALEKERLELERRRKALQNAE